MAWQTPSPGQEFPVGFDFAYLREELIIKNEGELLT